MVNPDAKLQMQLLESDFPFSKRMLNFFSNVEIYTVRQLTEIPLSKFTCFRGFKNKCMAELIAFIEFEQIQNYFNK
jgi:hypothetical protein